MPLPSLPSLPGMHGLAGLPLNPLTGAAPSINAMSSAAPSASATPPPMPQLPAMPSLPGMPALPAMPALPSMPALPGLPAAAGAPSLPGMPGLPGMPPGMMLRRGPTMLPSLPPPPGPPLDSGDLALSLDADAFRHDELAVEEFIKNELNLRLDTGASPDRLVPADLADAQICPRHLQPGGCLLGPACLQRHTHPAPRNFRPPTPPPANPHARMVCKHWLRGLCKKGPSCDFMHEYNLRKIPECYNFT